MLDNPGFETGGLTAWTVDRTNNQMDSGDCRTEQPSGWDSCSVFATRQGNTVITAHNLGASGLPGPFAELGSRPPGQPRVPVPRSRVFTIIPCLSA